MESVFGHLSSSSKDERIVSLNGRVLTARRLGGVLFLSVDNINNFYLYPLQPNNTNNNDNDNNNNITDKLDNVHLGTENTNINNKDNDNIIDKNNKEDNEDEDNEKMEDPFGLLPTSNYDSIELNGVLQVVLAKEAFKGEIQNKEGNIECNTSLKQLARTIAMGHIVEIIGHAERNKEGQLRVLCTWLKISVRNRAPTQKIMSKEDRDFQGHLPLCLFFRRGKTCTTPSCPYRHEFKDERERLNSINMQVRTQTILKLEKDPCDPHPTELKKHRHKRAELFVEWLLDQFKDLISALPKPIRILDIAGGRGEISLLLLDKGFDCVLLEPRDHKLNPKKMKKHNLKMNGNFKHLKTLLDEEFLASELGQETIAQTDIVIAMHPDQATEMAVDLSLKYNKPFAVVPCCVFPNLFPRKKRDGTEVVSYFNFVDYLLEKEETVQVGYLAFQGRTKVLYKSC